MSEPAHKSTGGKGAAQRLHDGWTTHQEAGPHQGKARSLIKQPTRMYQRAPCSTQPPGCSCSP